MEAPRGGSSPARRLRSTSEHWQLIDVPTARCGRHIGTPIPRQGEAFGMALGVHLQRLNMKLRDVSSHAVATRELPS